MKKFFTTRRFGEKILFLMLLVALTYVPQFHLPEELQVRVWGWLFIAALHWMRVWSIKVSKKAIPPEQRHRIEDKDLHTVMDLAGVQFCAKCSENKAMVDWIPWTSCKYHTKEQQ